jgi:uncharacterized membrane protein YhaH (DUF805 family)
VPKDKIGRITSIDFTLSLAITPIASLASGFLAEAFGLTTIILYCAIISILLTIPVWSLFVRRKINYHDENFIQTTKIRLEEMNGVKNDGRRS